MRRTTPPNFDTWQVTLVSAALLTGTLVRCGPGVRAVGWPDTPLARATALAPLITGRYVAVEQTAAWIWGAMDSPGTPLTLSTRVGRVPQADQDHLARKQFRLAPDDIAQLAEHTVTTPERTAYDLLRAPDRFTTPRRVACRLLILRCEHGLAPMLDRMHRSSRAEKARIRHHLFETYGLSW